MNNTITVFNPWTGAQVEKTIADLMDAIKSVAVPEECEAVNNHDVYDSDAEWLNAFIEIHSIERLSDIAFS